jgi:hypothetical protein
MKYFMPTIVGNKAKIIKKNYPIWNLHDSMGLCFAVNMASELDVILSLKKRTATPQKTMVHSAEN